MADGEKMASTCARDCGLLIIRLGLGICFIFHGWPKVKQIPFSWEDIGKMAHMPEPRIMGMIAAFIEFGGGILLALGFLTRPAAVLLFLQMGVAVFFVHLKMGTPMNTFAQYSHALEDGFVFLGLAFLGAGKLSADRKLFG